MSPPTSPIIILPNGDAVRADTITAVRANACAIYVNYSSATYRSGAFATSELAEAARDSVIEQWRAALTPAPAPASAAPGYARACAIVDEVLGGGS